MLKISKSVEYALLALRYIATRNGLANAKEISRNADIPYELLAKILQKLNRENIIESRQGKRGGYALSVKPEKLSLLTVMNALGQNVQLTDCLFETATADDCKRIRDCALIDPMTKIQNRIAALFKEFTLNEIIN
ncbi:MAG: Rrf2 family transcriptional regulator [Chlorobi bacterium]|nr:Rrf2 family transcriptional regulator [Chlorobiota bacterium]